MDRDSEQTQRGGEARQPAFSALGDSHACKHWESGQLFLAEIMQISLVTDSIFVTFIIFGSQLFIHKWLKVTQRKNNFRSSNPMLSNNFIMFHLSQ